MSKGQIKVKVLDYHRNGVSGRGFFSFLIQDNEYPLSNLLATAETTDENESEIEAESCRVVDTNNLLLNWRGDRYAYAIKEILKEPLKSSSLYDLKGETFPLTN